MSVLTHKNILIVGSEHVYVTKLSEVLVAEDAKLHHTSCADFSASLIEELHIELILVNDLIVDPACNEALHMIRDFFTEKAIPVFVLINDDSERIHEVLALGAADYITPQEDHESVVAKMKAVFGQGDAFSGSTAIDISTVDAEVTATGIRVFVVEDDPLLRNLLSLKMDKSKFPYEFSKDGMNVLPAMRQFKPDIVVLDLMLPGRSGFDVLAEIKGDEKLKSVPVVIFSNKDTQEDKQKAQEMGARGFYVKAMTDLSELIELIESLVK